MKNNIKIAEQILKIAKLLVAFNTEDIPQEANLSSDAKMLSYVPSSFQYFGNCINTVDTDKMWDATEMSGVLLQSDLLPTRQMVKKIRSGDRSLPSRLTRWIKKNQDKLDDMHEIVCGLNEYQKIAFIYITDQDMHYFFDAE